jgi:hypothetical protein
MGEPTEFQKTLANQVDCLRGRIISSYSQVEFLLADISVKLDLRFPYLIKRRINAVRAIAERPGYEGYREELRKVCDELLEYDDLRNFMAHGFLSITTDKKGNHELEFRMYQREDSEKFNLVMRQMTLPYLRMAAGEITEYVSHAVSLFQRIYMEQEVEK